VELPWYRPDGEWKHVSRAALAGWLVFYALFLLHAARSRSGFLLLDNVNLIIHEAGHFFFYWFGYTLMMLGGTLAQLLVPLLLCVYFAWHRHTAAVTFTTFWFFQNFLYVGTYMADARARALPLVGSGDHDWQILFGQWGLLAQDRVIGAFTRRLGWLGMLATVAWLVWMAMRTGAQEREPAASSAAGAGPR
jgi:hypothetical protein